MINEIKTIQSIDHPEWMHYVIKVYKAPVFGKLFNVFNLVLSARLVDSIKHTAWRNNDKPTLYRV